jgi:hypothetical protein
VRRGRGEILHVESMLRPQSVFVCEPAHAPWPAREVQAAHAFVANVARFARQFFHRPDRRGACPACRDGMSAAVAPRVHLPSQVHRVIPCKISIP